MFVQYFTQHIFTTLTLAIILLITSASPILSAEATRAEADALYDRAMTAMQNMNADSSKSVEAAVHLYEAKKIYAKLELWPQVREVNSYIFYCKKKMNVSELDAYIGQLGRGKAKEVRATFKSIEEETSQGLSKDDSTLSYQEASTFATDNPTEYLKIHMRFLEISERAIESNSTLAIKASRKSSEALQQWVQSKKDQGPPSPFKKAKRHVNLMGQDLGFPVPVKKQLKKLTKHINAKYKMQMMGTSHFFFPRELLKIAKNSIDQPDYAYACVLRAAELAMHKKIGDISLTMDCLDFIEEKFAVTDIEELRDDVISSGRSPVSKAAIKLLQDPNDAASNTIVGLAYCITGDNWKDGLALLQRCDNSELKKIAAMEIAKPKAANEQKQLADAWFALYSNKKIKANKLGILKRSVKWYALALVKLKGISKELSEKRVLAAARMLPVQGLEYYPVKNIKNGTLLSGKHWTALSAHSITADAGKDHTYTGVTLLPGQKIRVLPNTEQQWSVWDHSSGYKGSGWTKTFDEFRLPGESRKVSLGTLLVQVGHGPLRRATQVITGTGKVYLMAYEGGDRGNGSIECKIVALPR